jgi:hypothetical protein
MSFHSIRPYSEEPAIMSIAKLLTLVESLPRTDKLKSMQFLLLRFAQEEGIALELPEDRRQYPLWGIVGMAEGTESDAAEWHDDYLTACKPAVWCNGFI